MLMVTNVKQLENVGVSVGGFLTALKSRFSRRADDGAVEAAPAEPREKSPVSTPNRFNSGETGEISKMQDLRSALYSKD